MERRAHSGLRHEADRTPESLHDRPRDVESQAGPRLVARTPLPLCELLEQAALEICRTGSTTANRLSQTFKYAVDQYETDRPQFADTMLNPRETSYSIPQLVEFLATAELDLVSPVMPRQSAPELYICASR